MSFQFFDPTTLVEAMALGSEWKGRARFIAGGTDLVVQMRKGGLAPEAVINLLRLPGLSRIEIGSDRVRIGALVTHRAIERHDAFQHALCGLSEAASVVGGQQVRHLGTIGGNICNASPAADLLPMLLCLDADVAVETPTGPLSHRLENFVTGPRKTLLEPGHIVSGIGFDAVRTGSASVFLKAGRRRAMEISMVSVAALVRPSPDGTIEDVRIAVGAAAPHPFRATEAEQVLIGRRVEASDLARAAEAAMAVASPIDDVRASADYRRRMVGINVRRAVETCLARAGGPQDA